jgi:hypothetical protein
MPAVKNQFRLDITDVERSPLKVRLIFIGQLKLLLHRFEVGIPLGAQTLRGFARLALELAELE